LNLTRDQILSTLNQWNRSWAAHDLDAVMALFHETVYFENWTGGNVRGKAALRQAWQGWFADHGGFRFEEEDTFVDERAQKALYRWRLEWPSMEAGCEGRPETRRGVDVLHFADGKIIAKLTYSKTTVEIDGRRHRLGIGQTTP
jgi:ketosteroid isomerase-like protein